MGYCLFYILGLVTGFCLAVRCNSQQISANVKAGVIEVKGKAYKIEEVTKDLGWK